MAARAGFPHAAAALQSHDELEDTGLPAEIDHLVRQILRVRYPLVSTVAPYQALVKIGGGIIVFLIIKNREDVVALGKGFIGRENRHLPQFVARATAAANTVNSPWLVAGRRPR